MTPADKEARLRELGFTRTPLNVVQKAVELLEKAQKPSAYLVYKTEVDGHPLMAKKTAERVKDAYLRGDFDFLRNQDAQENGSQPTEGTESVEYEWPEYTASDLAELFDVNGIPAILLGLEMAKNQGNTMVPRFIERLFDTKERYSEMPASWRASVAGFPLIAEVINAPALEALAEVIELTHPYLGSKLRRDYHKRARPILRTIWGQISRWTAPSGYLLTPRVKTSPIRLETLDEWLTHTPSEAEMRTTKKAIEDALEKGKTVLLRDIQGTPSKVEETPEGLILDIVSRLPDVDRQQGKVFGRRLSFTAVLMSWCHICPDDYERYRSSQ